MRLELIRRCWLDRNWLEKTAVLVWSIVLIVVCLRVSISPRAHSVFAIFSTAGGHWRHAQDLYYPHFFDPDLDHFRYSPLAATLFAPWSILSGRVGNVVWRLFSAGLYLSALAWWARTVVPICLNRSQQALLFLLALPLSIGC